MQSRSSVEEMKSLPKMMLGCKFISLMSFTAACQHQVAAIIVGVLPSRNFPRLEDDGRPDLCEMSHATTYPQITKAGIFQLEFCLL